MKTAVEGQMYQPLHPKGRFDCAAPLSADDKVSKEVDIMPYRVYILLCSDGSYYTGSAANVEKRFLEHQEGVVKTSYTFSRRPVKLVWCSEEVKRYSDTLRFERQIKGWTRAKKEALIRNDFDAIHHIVTRERKAREHKKVSSR